jgi:uncharacterized membrane protein
MSKLLTFPRGLFIGAALMYLFDPRRGRARRARIADLAAHTLRIERQLVTKAARDAAHRARGLVQRVTHAARPGHADDAVVEARVRARLGRVVSHPGAIEISIRRGTLTLRGSVLVEEGDRAVRALRRVQGVYAVVDKIARHATADVPALHGKGRPPSEHWTPSARVAAVAGGATLALYGLAARGLKAKLLGAAGAALAARGTANQPVRRLLDHALGRTPIEIRKSILIHAAPEQVFALWSQLETFPRFLQHVREIVTNPREPARSRWEVDGPAGFPVHFETVTTRVVPNREISWTTLPEQPIEHTGAVRFEPVGGGTRVHIYLSYRPPGGAIGHAVAHVLGWDPKARIDDDMIRMKALLEEGQTRAHGERVSAHDLVH